MKKSVFKETPLFDIKKHELVQLYGFIYSFLLKIKKRQQIPVKYRAAMRDMSWGAAEILYLASYGYTKKSKFSTSSQYIRWNNAPKTLRERVLTLLGYEARKFYDEQQNTKEQIMKEAGLSTEPIVNTISYELRTDNAEVQARMQKYIEDFDLHSSIDQDILKNLIKTQIMIEYAQNQALIGKGSMFNVKELTDQLKNYTILLGLSKKDRVDLGAERKKGSIAELATIYEETLREYPDLEQEFLVEELDMLLDKYERLDQDGERELSAKTFRVVSGGYTIEEAREITGRKRKNVRTKKGSSSNT